MRHWRLQRAAGQVMNRRYVRESYGAIWLPSESESDAYDDAVEAFACNYDCGALFRRLLAIGLSADEVRWHAAHPGQRMMAMGPAPARMGRGYR
jgi:hypothetical protein